MLPEPVLVLACGALAKEILQLKSLNGWSHLVLQCLPADLHNRPDQIVPRLQYLLDKYQTQYQQIFIAYADCGTGGQLDALLQEYGVERLTGAHCYATYAGQAAFAELAEQELGTFYLTDFLARHFQRLVVQGLQLDRHPELRELYFAHYQRLVYLAQTDSPVLLAAAQTAAADLGLEFKLVRTGYGELETGLGGYFPLRLSTSSKNNLDEDLLFLDRNDHI